MDCSQQWAVKRLLRVVTVPGTVEASISQNRLNLVSITMFVDIIDVWFEPVTVVRDAGHHRDGDRHLRRYVHYEIDLVSIEGTIVVTPVYTF